MRIQFVFFPQQQQQNAQSFAHPTGTAVEERCSILSKAHFWLDNDDDDDDDDTALSFDRIYEEGTEEENDDSSSTASETTKGSSVSSMTMSSIESSSSSEYSPSCPQEEEEEDADCRDPTCHSASRCRATSSSSSLPCYRQRGGSTTMTSLQPQHHASNASCAASCPGAFHGGTIHNNNNIHQHPSSAADYYQASIAALAASYGTYDHPLVARTYHILGTWYVQHAAATAKTNYYPLAIRAYQLAIVHDDPGACCVAGAKGRQRRPCRSLADTYYQLGLVYYRQADNYVAALAFLEQASHMWQELLLLEDTDVRPVRNGPAATLRHVHYYMGLTCMQLEQWHRALGYLEASVRNNNDDDHDHTEDPHALEALHAMTNIHCQVTGNLLAARTCCRRMRTMMMASTSNSEQLRLVREAETMLQGATTTSTTRSRSSKRPFLHRTLWRSRKPLLSRRW